MLRVEANCHGLVRCCHIHISCVRKEPFWAFSIYIRLKIADFCVVRRNAVSSRARTQQMFHENALFYSRGFHSVLKQPKAIHSQ